MEKEKLLDFFLLGTKAQTTSMAPDIATQNGSMLPIPFAPIITPVIYGNNADPPLPNCSTRY